MFENPRRGRQARNFTTNAPKILGLKSSSEKIFSRKLPLGTPELCTCTTLFFVHKFIWSHCMHDYATWNCLISRFVEEMKTRQLFSFSFTWTLMQSFKIQPYWIVLKRKCFLWCTKKGKTHTHTYDNESKCCLRRRRPLPKCSLSVVSLVVYQQGSLLSY